MRLTAELAWMLNPKWTLLSSALKWFEFFCRSCRPQVCICKPQSSVCLHLWILYPSVLVCLSLYVWHVSVHRCVFLCVRPWALRRETPQPQPRCSYISVQFVPRPQIEIPFSGGKLSPTSPSGTQWIKIQISLTLHRCSPTPLWLSPSLPHLHPARRFAPCPLISSPLSSPLLCSSHRWLWFPPCSQLHWNFTFLPLHLPPLILYFSSFSSIILPVLTLFFLVLVTCLLFSIVSLFLIKTYILIF